MLIILHGEDSFRSRQKLWEIIEAYKSKNVEGFSFEKLNGVSLTLGELKSALESDSLFDNFKFLVLEDLALNRNLKTEFF